MLIKHFLIPHLLRDPLIGGFGWAKVSLVFCFRMPFRFCQVFGELLRRDWRTSGNKKLIEQCNNSSGNK
jgi:hypothetical protein